MGIMAAALDVTIPKLDQMLKKGEVLSSEALPKFAKALETAYKKLEILQPDYEDKMKAKILKEINEQKKEKFDEAKRQQKISKPVANANKPTTYEESQKALIRKFL